MRQKTWEQFMEMLEREEIPVEDIADIEDLEDWVTDNLFEPTDEQKSAMWEVFVDRVEELAPRGARPISVEYPWGIELRWGIMGAPGLWGTEGMMEKTGWRP